MADSSNVSTQSKVHELNYGLAVVTRSVLIIQTNKTAERKTCKD